MALELYFHPLASFCQKVLIALYENDTPFEPRFLDLGDPAERARFVALWPMGKMPVLVDGARNQTVPESTPIIEYLDRHRPGPTRFLPDDPDLALRTRLLDRIFDLHVHEPMQKVVTDRLRPAGKNDPYGVEQARTTLRTAYGLLERDIGDGWAAGDGFSLADCAAAPSLFYAGKVEPFGETHPKLAAYFDRLTRRPSYARVLEEARPWLSQFPGA